MLKHGTDKLIKMLTWVINRCLNGEQTPRQWKVAYISSIHKEGSKKDCSNYRGNSVMSRLQSNLSSRTPQIVNNLVYEQIFRTQSISDDVLCLEL